MKNIKRNGFIKFATLLIIELLLLKYLIGISFWFALIIVVFFVIVISIRSGGKVIYQSKSLAFFLVFILLIGLGKAYWQTNLPRSFNTIETTKSSVDQWLSKIMGDNTETMAADIWEIQKSKASNIFLAYYEGLLADGKTIEAADTLKKFNEKWNVDLLKDQAEKIEKIKKVEPIKSPINQVQDSIFTRGTYYINVKGKTSFNIVVVPTKHGCARYTLSSEKYNYVIIFSDGEIVQGSPGAVVAYREKPVFKLYSKTGDIVKLVVR
jgi:hypothetical protein